MFLVASAEGIAAITAGGTLLAALGVAAVTILTGGRRLNAERERQAAALTHDRALVDLADLRILLDSFAVALGRGRSVADEMEVRVTVPGSIHLGELAKQTAIHGIETGRELLALALRLQVRLGAEDPITVAADRAAKGMRAMAAVLDAAAASTESYGIFEFIKSAHNRFEEASAAFMDAAVGGPERSPRGPPQAPIS